MKLPEIKQTPLLPAPTPDAPFVRLFDIQGTGHTSPYAGQRVETEGVVTAVERRGFYVQDDKGDGDDRTSDAAFVFTGKAPSVKVGDQVSIVGTVEEFRRNGTDLSQTQIAGKPTVYRKAIGKPLPKAVELGSCARPLPNESIERAADRYEQLEGMRVKMSGGRIIGATNKFGDAYIAPDGANLPVEDNGVLRSKLGRADAARMKLSFDPSIYGARAPKLNVGDRVEGIEGNLFHSFGFYGIKPTSAATKKGDLQRDITSLERTNWGMTVATFNLENLDTKVEDPAKMDGGRPDDDVGSGKLDAIARQVLDNLKSPDILGIQEIQDNDGAEVSDSADASKTWQALVDAIERAGGPRYAYAERPPTPGADGGQPGGNIRVGYLYDPKRVELVEGSVARIGEQDPAFEEGRKSLGAAFRFKPTGTVLHTIVNHWASKHGSTPTYRDPSTPPVVGGQSERMAQQKVITQHVEGLLDQNPDARVLSLGDFNATEEEPALKAFGAGVLFNLGDRSPNKDRYSYIFQGKAQAIDHQFASGNLKDKVEVEHVNINAAFADRATDHDPVMSRIDMRP